MYPSNSINSVIYSSSAGFDPQMPMAKEALTGIFTNDDRFVSPGVQYLDDGVVRLTMDAGKEASRVEVMVDKELFPLEKSDNGLWHVDLKTDHKGFRPIRFFVDGAKALNPLMPVGFGSAAMMNVLEIPDESFFWMRDVPHGAVTENYYYSGVTGNYKSCMVYTPPGYMRDTSGEYPVLYLQHGHGENERCWVYQGKCNFIMDNLLAEGLAVPCIIVMNSGMVQVGRNGERRIEPKCIEDLLLKDCIPFIERTYRVKTDKFSRAMAGLSMGSMQTSFVTMKNPDMFGYAGVFSGFVSPLEDILPDGTHLSALDDQVKFSADYKVFFRACGTEDESVMIKFKSDSQMFADKGLSPEQCSSHIIKYYPGNHEWNVWRMCLRDFLQLIFR